MRNTQQNHLLQIKAFFSSLQNYSQEALVVGSLSLLSIHIMDGSIRRRLSFISNWSLAMQQDEVKKKRFHQKQEHLWRTTVASDHIHQLIDH